jgi:hypothetical protein
MADPLKERIARLQIGAAKGVLKPEHQAELERYVAQGLVKGQGPADTASTTNVDKEALIKAQDRSDNADKSLRLYGDVRGAIERFNPGPLKGTLYGALMPDEGGGFWDGLGAVVGAIPRSVGIISPQDQDDYARINSARAERIGIRSQDQAGVQARNDEIQFKLADISPYKSKTVNKEIIGRAEREAIQDKLRAAVESRWVTKYGSIANASPSGRTFNQALNMARDHFQSGGKPTAPRPAPPSTRKAAKAGWSYQEVK